MPSRGTMVCCFSHGVLTRAEREAIAKLRERREQGHVPGTTTHVATADRMDPLVSFYSSGHLVTTPASRTKLLPGLNATHTNSRPSGPARNNNHARHHKQHHGNTRPPQPTNCRANRPDARRQKQANHGSPQTHSQPGGSAGSTRPHTPRSVKEGNNHSHTLPGPSGGTYTASSAKAVAVGASTDSKPAVGTKPQRSKTQHRDMERRPGAGVAVSRAHTATTRPTNASNANGHQDKVNRTVPPAATKEALISKTTHTTGTVLGATGAPPLSVPAPRAPPPPPPAFSSQKASKTSRPPAPPPPIPPRVKHAREGGGSGNIVKMRSEGPNDPRKPVKPNHKAKSFGDSEVKTKDNSLRSNAHARTDVRPLHIAEAAPPRVRVNVRTANVADWGRQRRGGRTAGPGSAFAAVSAALGRRRGALQPSAAIVDTSIADAVATPSGVRARDRVADRRGGNGARVGKGHARRDVAPVTQGVSTMLKALTLLHVSRTAGMAGTPKSKSRSQAADETDTDEDADFDMDKEKENENRGNERKVGRIAWASKKRLEDVMSKLSGQSSKGERFVMKARPQLSDLADANNDVYFQKIMNDDH